jgi:hypothetical protein
VHDFQLLDVTDILAAQPRGLAKAVHVQGMQKRLPPRQMLQVVGPGNRQRTKLLPLAPTVYNLTTSGIVGWAAARRSIVFPHCQ